MTEAVGHNKATETTAKSTSDGSNPGSEMAGRARAIIRRRKDAGRFSFSRLTLTIVITNMISLMLLFYGSLSLTQYRDGLVQSKLEGVRAQAQIIADIMAQVAIDETDCIVTSIDSIIINDDTIATNSNSEFEIVNLPRLPINTPDSIGAFNLSDAGCKLSLVPGDVKEVFNRVWDSFEGRVRIFNAPGGGGPLMVTDASLLMLEDVMLREDRILEEKLPNIDVMEGQTVLNRISTLFESGIAYLFANSYRAQAGKRSIEDELNLALEASPFAEERGAALVRINENGELVASVSVPVRKVQAIHGIVTAEIGGIDDLVREARLAILPLFGFASAAAILSSLVLTAIIAQPIRQLALAADKVREGISAAGRARIPDFTHRRDEIGELSKSLKSMTQTIYARIEAIESFAADVSHELKNPLTSIRSATETLDIAKAPEAREKLMGVIKKDVARMDRLITDISNASRLDAELAREAREAVEVPRLISDIVSLYETIANDKDIPVTFTHTDPSEEGRYVLGNPSALGQVVRNIIDNARSFSPKGGSVRVTLRHDRREELFRIIVEDDGPGIPHDKLESVFNRFYTQRPKGTVFGNNSGLGLAISRQIVNAHGGRIWAENREAPQREDGPQNKDARQNRDESVLGARFVVELPVA